LTVVAVSALTPGLAWSYDLAEKLTLGSRQANARAVNQAERVSRLRLEAYTE